MNSATDIDIRHATARWLCHPPHGAGHLHSDSRAFEGLLFSVPEEPDPTPGETTPAELLAAAYSAFVATYLAQDLESDGIEVGELVVDVTCSLSSPERPPRSVEGVAVSVRGRVADIDTTRFEQAVEAAWSTCMRSLGLSDELHTELEVALV